MKKELYDNFLSFKSIIAAAFILAGAFITIWATIGFADYKTLSIILISLCFAIFVFYIICVCYSYYHLPRCKHKKVGVLFIITAKNKLHFQSITNLSVQKIIRTKLLLSIPTYYINT